MNSSLRNGLLLVTAVGTMMFPGERVRAADNQVAVPNILDWNRDSGIGLSGTYDKR